MKLFSNGQLPNVCANFLAKDIQDFCFIGESVLSSILWLFIYFESYTSIGHFFKSYDETMMRQWLLSVYHCDCAVLNTSSLQYSKQFLYTVCPGGLRFSPHAGWIQSVYSGINFLIGFTVRRKTATTKQIWPIELKLLKIPSGKGHE